MIVKWRLFGYLHFYNYWLQITIGKRIIVDGIESVLPSDFEESYRSEYLLFAQPLQNLLVTVSYGTNKMYRILLIIILHHVSAEKSDKAVEY